MAIIAIDQTRTTTQGSDLKDLFILTNPLVKLYCKTSTIPVCTKLKNTQNLDFNYTDQEVEDALQILSNSCSHIEQDFNNAYGKLEQCLPLAKSYGSKDDCRHLEEAINAYKQTKEQFPHYIERVTFSMHPISTPQ